MLKSKIFWIFNFLKRMSGYQNVWWTDSVSRNPLTSVARNMNHGQENKDNVGAATISQWSQCIRMDEPASYHQLSGKALPNVSFRQSHMELTKAWDATISMWPMVSIHFFMQHAWEPGSSCGCLVFTSHLHV